ncbi:MAG: histidine kinase N-terminal 7TM domain-containing protein [Natrialbaceae archaeon]
MGWQATVQAVPLFVAAALAGVAGVVAFRQRDDHGTRLFVGFVLAAAWWSLTAGFELLRTDIFWSVTLTKATYAGIVVAPITWVLFVLEYTGRRQWFDRRRLGLLFVVPVISLLALSTNEPLGVHNLFWARFELAADGGVWSLSGTYGPLFWLHSVYSYALLAIGSYWLLELAVLSEHRYRYQAIGLLGAVAAPWTVNALYLLEVIRTPYDPTILGIVLSLLLILATIRRHSLLDLAPAARKLARTRLLETLADPVVVIDDEWRVVDLNPAAAAVFDVDRTPVIGAELAVVSPKLRDWLDGDRSEGVITYDVENVERYYDVQVTPLSRKGATDSGTLLALRDVTARQHNRQQVSVLHRLLRHNLSNTVTTIHGNAEYAVARARDDEVRDRLRVIQDNAAAMMDKQEKLDRVLRTFERERYTCKSLHALLQEVVDTVGQYHPDAQVTVETQGTSLSFDGQERLRIALEELLTNAIEHDPAEAPRVHVSATVADGQARISITDRGPGIPAHELEPLTNGEETQLSHGSGVGLWLVSWIVHSLGGAVDFETDGSGTTVTLRIPGRELSA